MVQALLHELTVLCGITSTFILGPYFFEEVTFAGVKTFEIRNDQYTTMLQISIISEFLQPNVLNGIVWMQDSASLHATPCV